MHIIMENSLRNLSDLVYPKRRGGVPNNISAVSSPLGTIASICGLDVSNFGSAASSTMGLNAGSAWTRYYTQVYSSYDNAWAFCSSVEYVKCRTYMSGMYYDSKTNSMVAVPPNESSVTVFSSKYNDVTWKRQQAAIAFASGSPCISDKTGAVQYKYGSSVVITHSENF